ncbi:MAG TPA: hypothetical protein VNZ43_12350 [Sphingomonadaceae bacterium]|nr:hypothetical protein [Sphingomonadaceae bacterium]
MPDVGQRNSKAAQAWTLWEGRTLTLLPDSGFTASFENPHFAFVRADRESLFVDPGWLEDGQLIRDAIRLRDIPGMIFQGRYDMACPTRTAYDLHQVWPKADFHLIEGAGHAYSEPGILDRLIRTTDACAGAPSRQAPLRSPRRKPRPMDSAHPIINRRAAHGFRLSPQ